LRSLFVLLYLAQEERTAVPSAAAAAPPPGKGPFGLWLLDQVHRRDHIGELARYARLDQSYPSDAALPEDVYDHLVAIAAGAEQHVALEAAEIDWYAY
jgi:hypothetical protein